MSHHRVIVAVSGTIEDGFELRPNIDYRDPNGTVVPALFLGYGVFKGVKMYFDVKNIESREYADTCPHRVNPAMVLTGDPLDINQYSLYLVDERACLSALLGEPRFLTMTPDTIRLQLNDKDTSPTIRALAQAVIRSDNTGKNTSSTSQYRLDEVCVLAVVPCFHSKHFYPAPFRTRTEDGSRFTSFRYSLAAFAGIDGDYETFIGTPEWNLRIAKALDAVRASRATYMAITTTQMDTETATNTSITISNHGDAIYGSDKNTARLSRRMTIDEFNCFCIAAGLDIRAS